MENLVYEPKGKAREYSPLAINVYNGCNHGCTFCYMRRFTKDFLNPRPKKDFLKKLEEIKSDYGKQILFSFSSDPYCSIEFEHEYTKKALEVMLETENKVAILTKAGTKILRDLELFKLFGNKIKVGATLTFDNDRDSLKTEPGAALPEDRLDMLQTLKRNGIRTFASFEPVIDPNQSLNLMRRGIDIIDMFKIGKLNGNKEIESKIDWKSFAEASIKLMLDNKKEFYIKKDLAKYIDTSKYEDWIFDQDYLAKI